MVEDVLVEDKEASRPLDPCDFIAFDVIPKLKSVSSRCFKNFNDP